MLTHGEGFFMSPRDNSRHQVVIKFIKGKISRSNAANLLQVSERTITRLAKKVQNKGIFGIKHGNLGRDYGKKYSDELRNEILNLLTEKYFDFNLKHFHEIITSPEYGYDVSYIALWKWCKKLNYIKNPRNRRSKPKNIGIECLQRASYYKWMGVIIDLMAKMNGVL